MVTNIINGGLECGKLTCVLLLLLLLNSGMVINIINGGLECGKDTPVDKEATRISYYSRMAAALGVTPDPNTSCANMRPF